MKHYGKLLLLLVAVVMGSGDGAGKDLTQKCGQVVQKVIPCLNYATGKASTPSKECCEATTKIRESDPDCLCFIIQQTHHGNPESKSLGIQEDKLLHLPSLCNVKNANIADCPKLLGLSPSSPDAAIFKNASKATPAAPLSSQAPPLSSTPPKSQNQNDSYGVILRPPMTMELIMLAMAIVLIAIPTGFVTLHI
ncbi:non-specific lipid transfer protein GPI-anchored 1-like [Arachis stenosperma]|uniref:non-specific lipid transfer protein GPI-anchored 1-like n=1 Tax=Arachis stenosperma TaxID=217475 RepID=UPI0025ABF5E8|nr:non-specific lipid transfer protein GPI-anchored 1-like [Arachis stenosperma]